MTATSYADDQHREATQASAQASVVVPARREDRQAALAFELTNAMAAVIVADPDFPDFASLPSLAPPPFCNFGHQALLDYPYLARTVWGVAMPLVQWLGQARWTLRLVPPLAALAGFVIGAIFADLAGIPMAAGTFVALVAYFVTLRALSRSLQGRLASARQQAITSLLDDKPIAPAYVPPAVQKRLGELAPLCGNGDVGSKWTPVVVGYTDAHPFPGYGRLQNDATFVCVPLRDRVPNPSSDRIEPAVLRAVHTACERMAIREISLGRIVSLDARSLHADSQWLVTKGSPPLWMASEVESIEAIDPRASVRMYNVVQLGFSRYESIATLFIRGRARTA